MGFFIKIKNFWSLQTTKRMKRHATGWEKISVHHISNKGVKEADKKKEYMLHNSIYKS